MSKNKQKLGLSASVCLPAQTDTGRQTGATALPTLLLVGSIIMGISIALTVSVYLYVNSSSGANLSLKALSIAKSGIYDGIMKVVRDKSLISASYPLTVGEYIASVDICRDTELCGGSGKFKITSIGRVFTRAKKMEAIVSVDNITGVAKLESLKDVAL